MNHLYPDYLRFHAAALNSKDVDPVYPVYGALLDSLGIARGSGSAFWLTVCHVTWYDMGSAIRAWSLLRQGVPLEDLPRMPCATERRGNRDDKQLLANLRSWREQAPKLLEAVLPAHPGHAWRYALGLIEGVHGNGRWASYKMAELLQKVNGWPLKPLDMGHANSSGPRRGLELLVDDLPQGNSKPEIERLDATSEAFCGGLRARGLPARIEEVETTLCDFHALVEGRYYVGNDIDQMAEQLHRGHAATEPRSEAEELFVEAWRARRAALPEAYLGEIGGWRGIDKARQKAYRDTGEVLVR